MSASAPPRPERTVRALVSAGVTHVVGIPDNTSGPLFDEIVRHPTVRLVPVTREGEAFALASGLWLGGVRPLVVVQNTGLLESGDAVRGTVQRMGAPVPIVVTGRGYAKMEAAGVGPSDERTLELMTRFDLDTTAPLTEPTLEAWGLPFERCGADDDPADAITELLTAVSSTERARVLILTRPLT